ncbi:hypothetical protein FQR65_LT01476 [Abscondita terminalis]|nr:hypothetical protein FQR65_LT01476 [Abscondita terminalis]
MKIYPFVIFFLIYFIKCGFGENLKLLILHNNDMHSRFEETSRTSGTCKDKTNCYGGFARVLHVIREARRAAADGTGPPVLYLNAGDTYTGTAWFSVHKWKIAADFLNLLHPDVASFGNHEFDFKPKGIVPLLNAISFPMVAANVDFTKDPQYHSTNVTKSYVLNVRGKKIGVIGYVLPNTATVSSPGDIVFTDEIHAIKEESERLDRLGVKIIIALGHSGFAKDKEIAIKVPLVDVVVGGHTNTFLWNGPKPDLEEVEGPYPVVVEQSNGKKVPVVQAYAYTKYMGRLNITFDDNGDVVAYSGQPQLLDNSVQQDQQALLLLETFRPAINAIYNDVIGKTRVALEGKPLDCRIKECNLGNFIADAFVAYHASTYTGRYWTDAPIGLLNAGAIRNSIISKANGTLTKADILSALPFDDDLYLVSLNGSDLQKTLEIGVRYDGNSSRGELIIPSGIHYVYDMQKPVGSRVTSVKVRCGLCNVPTYEHLVLNKTYRIILNGFLKNGGDGHHIIKTNSFNVSDENKSANDVVAWFVSKTSPIYPEEDERVIGLNVIKGFTFGNHDFDYGVAGVVPFLNAISFPVVAANMNFSKEPSLQATNVTKSYVLEIAGRKIGIIGYLTAETAEQSTPENVIFYDEIESVRNESERLAQDGIDVIIALGHSGYEVDQKIAKEVPLVDAVVGGHTNTFLSSKGQMDLEVPDGPYPTVVTQVNGKKVPVVQAYGFTKYIGRLTLVFDDKGDLIEFEGEPQLLNPSVPQDADALRLLDKFRPEMDAINTDVIGLTKVELDGNLTKCRLGECNFINLITDSLVAYHLSKYDGYYWTDAAVALMNAGCVRSGIDRKMNGTITKGDILAAMPFDDLVYTLVVTGRDLLDTLETGVRGNGDASSGEAIHASGIFYTYDRSKKVGSRIIHAKIRCSQCRIPKYEDINPEKTYKIIVPGFLSKGGDGHHVLKTNGLNRTIEDKSTWDTVQWYIKKTSPVFNQEEGRVVEYKSNEAGFIMSLGNHEFDHNVTGLVPFLNAINFPTVAANLDFSKEPELEATNVTKSYVTEILGYKIGIIGYLLPQTVELASTSNVIFTDEIVAIKTESERLNRDGCKIIIALGHSGFLKDLEIAREVPLVDLVIGGHSNTFLWNGAQPDLEKIEGPYPVVVEQLSGKKVPVVQAYAYTKYMGRLNMEFNENGDAISYSGQPLLLDDKVMEHPEALALVERYRKSVDAATSGILGITKVFLDGSVEHCRHKECNLGNLIADAFVAYRSSIYNGPYWTDTPIALYNGGSIRNNIEPADGIITGNDVLSAFPYTDSVCYVSLNGSDLLKTLEIAVRSNGETSYGEFLQVSGLTYRFDTSKQSGSRIIEAKARCGACPVPRYDHINPHETYKIITRGFLCDGGDGFTTLKNAKKVITANVTETEIVMWYIKHTGVIFTGNEDRLVNVARSGSFGNHEFDFTISGLIPFLEAINFPIVAANMDFSEQPEFGNITKSKVIQIGDRKIGVIGYLTPETANVNEMADIKFVDEVVALIEESERLDREVPLVDLVIGGHTNTFLFSGPKPDLEEPDDSYPVLIKQSNGKIVPVVQAYAFTKYMGRLLVTFNEEGDLIHFHGSPQLIDNNIPEENDAIELLETFRPAIQSLIQPFGKTKVVLDGSEKTCRFKECNFGNLVTDAFIKYHALKYDGNFWTDAPIAIINGGTFRSILEIGDLSVRDVYEVIPYKDKIVSMSLKGDALLNVLETSVRSNGETSFGEFLQVSGLHYTVDKTRPVGQRVVEAKVRCGLCSVPGYGPIVPEKNYRVITRRFLSDGADGYVVLKEEGFNVVYEDINMIDVVIWYINMTSPILIGEENRITCFGNHEFAYKAKRLSPFMSAINFPMVAANIDFSQQYEFKSFNISKSWVFNITGKQIGVIGYTTPFTMLMADTQNIRFGDEIVALKAESELLHNAGVKTIIALGHSGFETDLRIAREVPLVDLVIGGHTNTFLWNGPLYESPEVPRGPYPVIVQQANGKMVPVVQAYAFTKYMGRLTITIDDYGNIISYEGWPQLLHSRVPQEPDALLLLELYRKKLQSLDNIIVGYSVDVLRGETRACRYHECSLANLVTDAFAAYSKKELNLDSIALISSKTTYHDVIPRADGTVSMLDLVNALPFKSKVYSVSLKGEDLWNTLEIGVSKNPEGTGAEFIHTSGLQYVIDMSKPVGSRIVEVKVRSDDPVNPTYHNLIFDEIYRLIITDILYKGLDFQTIIQEQSFDVVVESKTELEIVLWYFREVPFVNKTIEGRIISLT